MRLLIVKPEAFMQWLERAYDGETPEDLMFEALDIAGNIVVNMEVQEDG